MRPATGPLQTDTYIVEVTEAPGEYVAVKSDRSKFALTNDYRTDEVAKWFIERLGDDVYRCSEKDLNVAPAHDLRQNTVDVGEGSAEWIIRETDVPGVYSGSPAGGPNLYAYIERRENHIDVKLGAEQRMTKIRFFRVD